MCKCKCIIFVRFETMLSLSVSFLHEPKSHDTGSHTVSSRPLVLGDAQKRIVTLVQLIFHLILRAAVHYEELHLVAQKITRVSDVNGGF